MIVATPVDGAGNSAAAWGKAHWIAVATVDDATVTDWSVHEVAWDVSHDAGTHGSHHARVVTFLRDNSIEAIVVDHVGDGMRRILHNMSIPTLPASPGNAQDSVVAAVRHAHDLADHTDV